MDFLGPNPPVHFYFETPPPTRDVTLGGGVPNPGGDLAGNPGQKFRPGLLRAELTRGQNPLAQQSDTTQPPWGGLSHSLVNFRIRPTLKQGVDVASSGQASCKIVASVLQQRQSADDGEMRWGGTRWRGKGKGVRWHFCKQKNQHRQMFFTESGLEDG